MSPPLSVQSQEPHKKIYTIAQQRFLCKIPVAGPVMFCRVYRLFKESVKHARGNLSCHLKSKESSCSPECICIPHKCLGPAI